MCCNVPPLPPLCYTTAGTFQWKQQTASYSVFLSLVINELDGLARGPESEHRVGGYARLLQERARKAIEFLEARFERRDSYMRALTSRGNELESISFRSEDISRQQVNGISLFSQLPLYPTPSYTQGAQMAWREKLNNRWENC